MLFCLGWDYIGRTRTFFALSDLEFNLLAFIKLSEAFHLNFGVMDKQIIASVVRLDETVSLTRIKPFYLTCTHWYFSPAL